MFLPVNLFKKVEYLYSSSLTKPVVITYFSYDCSLGTLPMDIDFPRNLLMKPSYCC